MSKITVRSFHAGIIFPPSRLQSIIHQCVVIRYKITVFYLKENKILAWFRARLQDSSSDVGYRHSISDRTLLCLLHMSREVLCGRKAFGMRGWAPTTFGDIGPLGAKD